MREYARHEVRRSRERARYDVETVHAILDAGFLAHVGFVVDGQPFVIPMLYVRDGDDILLHGSIASRLMNQLGEGVPVSISVSHIDGLVLARSHFHHSVNYRSVVCFGTARRIDDGEAKATALAGFVDAILPGRAAESRPSDRNELAATAVLRVVVENASAKIRSGGPKDDPADRALPVWAGVVPTQLRYGEPENGEDVAGQAPPSVRRLLQRQNEVITA
ncbi:pyridoxamine 5'-phosphate oxidase family protein [Tahibacter amnicola]|uniref:Pyridoxamine 5'-phosphate oxidase family protein n=1 Tax=Tahibacter amnicola TaxID=2976241 RepID=A0ABY6BC78_9GAMM|nr:pyridoxamine 5'-phosphate oxidase family protein [Tahibacter amnicola]UXI67469.1 pyridoxamine 5'-phosphate oxidase family protein [Tahibacter amnicola]